MKRDNVGTLSELMKGNNPLIKVAPQYPSRKYKNFNLNAYI